MYQQQGVCPAYIAPASPTTEFANMNGAESAAVCFEDAHCKAINKGARNTPPPTPVSPDTKPTAAPMLIALHNGVGRRKNSTPRAVNNSPRMV
jgi:hypothetical protein